ncbi:ATP-binding cassette domain-containing protein [Microbacterium sp. RD1]|uniref:ATP-binding cassette domain-containing protein n=1 Tax=Microbacterium sp. RD1 TaxID=3457313 RepID=UPI003FA5ED29
MTTIPISDTDLRRTSTQAWRGFFRRPLATAAVAVLLIIVLACALAPWLAPDDPLTQDLAAVQQLPSAAHWLGTDSLGRDVLSRLMWGGQPALLGALVATAVYAIIGIVLGLAAGFSSGILDRVISTVVDIAMSLPGIVIMFAVVALFDNNLFAAMITLGIFAAGGAIRVVRAATKATKEELYVSAARVTGVGTLRILARHIAPRLVGPVTVLVSLFSGVALVVQSGLGFLGLGIQEPYPSWGGMVAEAARVLITFPWLLVPSGGIIAITVLSLGLIGDALRDTNAASTRNTAWSRQARAKTRAQTPVTRSPVERSDAVLDVRDLTITFEAEEPREVVHGISMRVDAGEIVGLVGESGSGKTVTALSVLGLAPANASVTAERFDVTGEDLRAADEAVFRRIRGGRVGLVSQEPMVALDPSFTVGFQLKAVLRAQTALRGRALHDRAIALLEDVRLPDPHAVMRRYPHELSGGMAQRVVIAVALAGDPRLLIADEPTTALDVTVQADILDLLRRLRDEHGMAIILVTHDLGVVADLCERVYVLQRGHVVEEQETVGLFAEPRDPYTADLIAATPSLVELPVRNGGTRA